MSSWVALLQIPLQLRTQDARGQPACSGGGSLVQVSLVTRDTLQLQTHGWTQGTGHPLTQDHLSQGGAHEEGCGPRVAGV